MIYCSSHQMMSLWQQLKIILNPNGKQPTLGNQIKSLVLKLLSTKIQSVFPNKNILRQEHMNSANPVGTPLDHNVQIEPNPNGNQGSRSNSYACLLGELQWVANVTRPDIAYAINKLATYTANPSLQHVGILKCILRYLAGTKNLGITYSENPDHDQLSTLTFHGYADAAFGNSDDLKSTSGYVRTPDNSR